MKGRENPDTIFLVSGFRQASDVQSVSAGTGVFPKVVELTRVRASLYPARGLEGTVGDATVDDQCG